MEASAAELRALDARLRALSPLAVLDRGYALVLAADGAVVRSSAQISAGDHVATRLAEGEFTSRVESTTPAPPATRMHPSSPTLKP